MLFELVDTLQKRRRLVFVALFVLFDVCLLSFCTQTLQAHRSSITERIHDSESSQRASEYDGISEGIDHVATAMEVGILRVVVAAADTMASAQHGVQAASKITVHATGTAVIATSRATGYAVIFTGRMIAFPFIATGRGIGYAFGAASRVTSTHLASVIKPKNDIALPVITAEQAQQASLIQTGTFNFEPIKPIGSGGACDNGGGNGGYPMEWCDARIDTLQAKAGSTSRINRECTSYAYWYFTEILGHTDFQVWGNANRWARTSNYPTHKEPAVDSIAVETAGAYGHVAIVHALPGQVYEGKVVPDGYVLVSEMNYDWHGHFRYSYSPVTKFSAYIYP